MRRQFKGLMRILAVAMWGVSAIAWADDVPLRTPGSAGREKTFYNNVERLKSHDREGMRLTEDRYAPVALERERVRLFYLTPEVGVELATIGASIYRSPLPDESLVAGPTLGNDVALAPAFGLQLGWRIGALTLGARYQGSVFQLPSTLAYRNLSLNKIYGEIGFNAREGVMIASGFADVGYAFAATRDTYVDGVGAKVGINFDFLINRYFSMGPGFAFDVHAYNPDNNNTAWLVVLGGTAQLRLGFHI